MLNLIDRWLDRVTMYRLAIYYLLAILAVALALNIGGQLQYSSIGIVLSAAYLTLLCWLTNLAFGKVFETPVNSESAIITALILALIITPLRNVHDLIFLTAAGGLAIASKYILAYKGKHIFNPAAVAVVLTAIGARQAASWWVGNQYLLPIVAVGGWLLIRKIEREWMAGSFLAAATITTLLIDLATHRDLSTGMKRLVLNTGLVFLASIMLSEPATSPTTRHKQVIYGLMAGVMFPPQAHIGSLYTTPERALVVANAFAWLSGARTRLLPRLSQRQKVSSSVVDFVFQTAKRPAYEPGQYMEWTLPHPHADSRGIRRYFTLASSPTEDKLRIGVKFFEDGSSYKKAMLAMNENTPVAAGQLGGDFRLPANKAQKLVFVAGGIGVTPYRSMLKYLTDKNEQRDIVLLYSEKTADEIAYHQIFDEAREKIGLKTLYTLSKSAPHGWKGLSGVVDAEMIKSQIPDWQERLFYISGPQPMVQAIKTALKKLGLPARQIKTDFFPGYA